MNLLKILPRWTLIVVTIVGVSLAPVTILDLLLKIPGRSNPPQQTAAFHKKVTGTGLPERLEIPKIGINAALDDVGITAQGELGVPTVPANAAWYDQGPRPGENGNAVIDGHFGYRDNIPAVFDNLHSLQKGDKLYVKDQKGMTTAFVVSKLQTYSPDEYASAVFRSNDGKAHLNLITCEGTWNQTRKSFSNRLVVFADKEG